MKHHIDRTAESSLCTMCGEKGKSVCHVVSDCKKLPQKEYKRRHYNVARIAHWSLCELYQLGSKEKFYEHVPEGALENGEVKLFWDMNIQCDNIAEAKGPEIIVVSKKENKCTIVDIAIAGDSRIHEK